MTLTSKQEEGLKIAVERYKNKERFTIIGGYAGSGKSTLIKYIIAALKLNTEDVAYVAFTGKAANVLTQKGCPNATTAHKLLYNARLMPNGKYIFVPKKTLEFSYKLIVVDEVSMLPVDMWNLLLRHGIHILATGDPGQLPPINKEDDNHVLDKPHIFLDEIMRQAQESDIIRLSMHVREGQPIGAFKPSGGQVKILKPFELVSGVYEWPDQIICATNEKRNEINQIVRNLKGYGEEPVIGDKIISLKNHWDYTSIADQSALTNGTIGYITNLSNYNIRVPKYIYPKQNIPSLLINFDTEDYLDGYEGIMVDYNSLANGQKTLDSKQEYLMFKNSRLMDPPFEFVYGYAITCHKSQGSEWEKVLVFEESFPHVREEHIKWLYTAITRASEKLVIIQR